MWWWGKRDKYTHEKPPAPVGRDEKEIEQEVVQSCVAQIQESFLDMNKQLTVAFSSVDKIKEAVDTNSINVASLSQSITALAEYYRSLDLRLKALEDRLALTGVTFTKGNTN